MRGNMTRGLLKSTWHYWR